MIKEVRTAQYGGAEYQWKERALLIECAKMFVCNRNMVFNPYRTNVENRVSS